MGINEDNAKQWKDRRAADDNRDSYSWNSATIRKSFDSWKAENGTFLDGSKHRQRSRLRYFYTLAEPDLGVYLQHGAQKATTAYLLGNYRMHTRYMIGFADITVDLLGRDVQVRIVANDSFYFEFVASGKPVSTVNTTQLGSPVKTYNFVTVGVDVGVHSGALTYNAEIRNGTRSIFGDNSIINRPGQIQLINEPVSYPQGERQLNRLRFPVSLYESWAPGTAHTGVHFRNTSWGLDSTRVSQFFSGGWAQYWLFALFQPSERGAHWPHASRDINYDVPFEKTRDFAKINPVILRGSSDWPRATGLQIAKSDDWGTREFAIYVDAFNQFFVFPTEAATAWTGDYTQNVDPMYVQQATYSMPAWVFAPTSLIRTYYTGTNQWLVDFPELDWKAHPEGTKFAAVVYERAPFNFDSTYFTTGGIGGIPMDATKFNTLRDELGVAGRWGISSYSTLNSKQRYFVGTGILELALDIQLTGPNLEDFTVVATPREVRRPTTTEYCTFAVDYIADDMPIGAKTENVFATKGELVAMDIEQWAEAGVHTIARSLVTIRKVDTDTVLFSSRVPTQITALNLSSLSFMARIDNPVTETKSMPVPSSSNINVQMQTLHFAMWAVIGLESKELLYPKTMTEDQKAYFTSLVAEQGFTGIDDAQAAGLYRVPLNESRDWTDPDFAATRDYISQPSQANHKSAAVALTAGITATLTKWYWEWANFNPCAYLIYCDAPKFGWHLYADLICRYIGLNPSGFVFFTHPNGTWAYWDSGQVYNLNGICPTGDLYTIDQYTGWDPALVEHCVFDRVHFEAKVGEAKLGTLDTTFLDMYNAGVRATTKKGEMVDDVQEIADADLRATFSKSSISVGLGTRVYLKASATWDGTQYDFYDTGVQGGSSGTTFIIGNTLLSLDMSFPTMWITPGLVTVNPLLDPTTYHIRFANPLVLDGVKENN